MSSQDLRVPTFIPYETAGKRATKRKRLPKKEDTPNKKKALKPASKPDPVSRLSPELTETVGQIWIGAIVGKDKGAFSIYFGENDKRNYYEVFKRDGVLQDLDYAYILGTLKAVEMTKHAEEPLIVNTCCRILARAIAGRAQFSHYQELASKIRVIIDQKGYKLRVNYVSRRSAPQEQKIALDLASGALSLNVEPAAVDVKDVDDLDIAYLRQQLAKQEAETTAKIEEPTASKDQTSQSSSAITTATPALETNDKKVSIENTEEAHHLTESSYETTQVVVETKTATRVEIKVELTEESEATEETEANEQAPTSSSWASAFGIKNLIDILSSPFRSRKSL